MKIGIIGMGHVGATLAYTLCLQGLAETLILIDTNEAKVQAEYLELSDAVKNLDHDVKIKKNDSSLNCLVKTKAIIKINGR